MIQFLHAEYDALRIFSHSAIVNYGKVIAEKNNFEKQLQEMK